ncbi:hypothetical protein LTS01_020345, partial [Friedmanniomyces endolithicus]
MGGMKAAETTSTVRAVSNSVSTDGGNAELALVSVKSADEGGLVADQATVGSDGMDLVGDRVVYNTLGWVKAALIMIAETISLGILSLPAVLAAIGLVPGILFIVVFGL